MATPPLLLKKNYRCVPSLQQFYTGGPLVVSFDGSFIVCACGESIKVVESSNASIRSTLDGDSEAVTALALSPDDKLLFSSGHSRQIKVWDLSTLKCLRSWKVIGFNCLAFYFKNGFFFGEDLSEMTSLESEISKVGRFVCSGSHGHANNIFLKLLYK